MNRHKNTEYNAVMIDASVLHDSIKYGIPRTFIKNNYLKMHGKPMIRKSTRACLKNKNCTKRMFYFPFS